MAKWSSFDCDQTSSETVRFQVSLDKLVVLLALATLSGDLNGMVSSTRVTHCFGDHQVWLVTCVKDVR